MTEHRKVSNHALVDVVWVEAGKQVGERLVSPGYAFPIFVSGALVTIAHVSGRKVEAQATNRTWVDIPRNRLYTWLRLHTQEDPLALREAMRADGWERWVE